MYVLLVLEMDVVSFFFRKGWWKNCFEIIYYPLSRSFLNANQSCFKVGILSFVEGLIAHDNICRQA